MTDDQWRRRPLMEKLSDIAGEVKRCTDCKLDFDQGISSEDYSEFYFNKASELIDRTFDNAADSYRKIEFTDELAELRRFLNGEVDQDYIMRYWNQFTEALSMR